MENNLGVCCDDDDDDDDDGGGGGSGTSDWEDDGLESGDGVSKNDAILRIAGTLQKMSILLTFP